MTKIVYNTCYGGFSLSTEAVALGQKMSGDPNWGAGSARDIPRSDGTLLAVIDQIGAKAASGSCANLAVCGLPAGTRYIIHEYDGMESVMRLEDFDWQVA